MTDPTETTLKLEQSIAKIRSAGEPELAELMNAIALYGERLWDLIEKDPRRAVEVANAGRCGHRSLGVVIASALAATADGIIKSPAPDAEAGA